jgi:hypothetical protein
MSCGTDMQISMAHCKARLATFWFVGSCTLFIVVLIQTIMGHYGDKIEDVWGWFLPTVMPTLSLVVGVLVADALGKGEKTDLVDRFLFRLTYSISLAYLLIVALTILSQPIAPLTPLELLKTSHLWLGPLQGLVTASLGAFFIRGK